MNKYQEALDYIESIVIDEDVLRIFDSPNYLPLIKNHIKLLQELIDKEKETPKKPIKVKSADDSSVREGSLVYLMTHFYKCPNCHRFLGTSFLEISMYCRHCGQKLDWSDEND